MAGARKETVVFAPETINIAETTRMIEVARALGGRCECLFIGYGDEYAGLVVEAGFELLRLEPRLTAAKVEHLWKVDRMESFADPFSEAELRERVAAEVAVYRSRKVAAVVAGFTLSTALSARVAGIPLVYVMPFPLTRPFLEAGLAGVPDAFYRGPLRLLPRRLLDAWTNRWLLGTGLWTGPFRKVAAAYGIHGFGRLVDLYSGDLNCVTDLPSLAGVDRLPRGWRFVGPIYAKLGGEVPANLAALPKDKPLVWFAMGSSANRDLLLLALEAFRGLDCRVIAPIGRHLEGLKAHVPPNVLVRGWLPAHLVNPLADIAVIHGGQGTVQTALASGTPFVGIGLQPEQEANIEAAVRAGCARRVRKHELSPVRLRTEILALLADGAAREAAGRMRAELALADGPALTAEAIMEVLEGRAEFCEGRGPFDAPPGGRVGESPPRRPDGA